MKKFMALYMIPPSSMDEMVKTWTEEQMKKGMDEWSKWMKDNENIFVDKGTPLGKNKRLTSGGASDVRNDVTGYSIIQAGSYEEAVELLKNSPHLQMPEAYIEILECRDMAGM